MTIKKAVPTFEPVPTAKQVHEVTKEMKRLSELLESSDLLNVHSAYESPIILITQQFQAKVNEEYDNHIMNIIESYGIYIDKDTLIAALNADRSRYEEAYQKGYNTCKQIYQEKLKQIIDLVQEK